MDRSTCKAYKIEQICGRHKTKLSRKASKMNRGNLYHTDGDQTHIFIGDAASENKQTSSIYTAVSPESMEMRIMARLRKL